LAFPEDLNHFRELTLGKIVLMGRATFESILKRLGKPLPRRTSIVLTTQKNYSAPSGVRIFHDIPSVIQAFPTQEIYVIGGATIFNQLLPFCELAYITHIHKNYEGDSFFPKINFVQWHKLSEERHPYLTFSVYSIGSIGAPKRIP
jgi:dihydrofolate reductase